MRKNTLFSAYKPSIIHVSNLLLIVSVFMCIIVETPAANAQDVLKMKSLPTPTGNETLYSDEERYHIEESIYNTVSTTDSFNLDIDSVIFKQNFRISPTPAPVREISTLERQFDSSTSYRFSKDGYVSIPGYPSRSDISPISASVRPLHADASSEITISLQNGTSGRYFIRPYQENKLTSINGLYTLDIDCCISIYTAAVEQALLDQIQPNSGMSFVVSLNRINSLLEDLAVSSESGTYNSVVDIEVFPIY